MKNTKNLPTRAASYGQPDFRKITSTRAHILEAFLLQGLTTYYFDVDTVWLQNVWTEYVDKQIGTPTLLQWDRPDVDVCTGMLYLEPQPQIFVLLREWKQELASKRHREDQYAFNAAFPRVQESVANFVHGNNSLAQFLPGFKVQWDIGLLGSLLNFLGWARRVSLKDPSILVIHNNFIKGKDAKFQRLLRAQLWKPSGKLDPELFQCLCNH